VVGLLFDADAASALPDLGRRLAAGLVPETLVCLGATRPEGINDLRPRRDGAPWQPIKSFDDDHGRLSDRVGWWMLPAGASID
jgi:hypothetical protein